MNAVSTQKWFYKRVFTLLVISESCNVRIDMIYEFLCISIIIDRFFNQTNFLSMLILLSRDKCSRLQFFINSYLRILNSSLISYSGKLMS
jgi:hypothetical protein